MMNISPFKVVLFSVAGFLLPLMLFAGEIRINNGSTEIRYTLNTYQELSFTQTLSSLQFRDVNTKLGLFTELYVAGFGYSPEVGSPKLPAFHKLIEIPLNASCQVKINRAEYSDYDLASEGVNYRIIPQQAPVSKEITDPGQIPFVIDEAAYLKNEFLGGPLVSVAPAGMMRALNLATLSICPVLYNPVTGILRIYSVLEVTIVFVNGNESATINLKKDLWSPYFMKAYSMAGNYKPVTDELITTAPVTYIIVSDPMFENALQPFIDWKTRKGFKVVEAYTDDPAVGNTTTTIKNYLQNFFITPPAGYEPQSFVLFVGDVAQIPTFNGTAGSHPTDLYYCEYTGDKIPECYYGRFSATNLTQLQPQIDKTLEYEQYLFPDESFLGEVVMVAGADASHQLTWGNGQINYGTTYYFNSAHNILSHTYLQPEPPGGNYSAQIIQNVSDGVAYANYTAHCGESGWSDPSFTIANIAGLQNNSEYCLMVGNCCLSNRFNTTCFGEEQLRAENKGSLGYIGASNNSYWDEDYWWGVGFKAVSANPTYDPNHLGAYDVTFHDQGEPIDDWFVTQGQMVVGGNMAVQESSTSASSKTYYWEIYHLMGDPSLMAYLSIPPVLNASYPDILLLGSTTFDVTTEPYAYIGLSRNGDEFITAVCADSTGAATLTFPALNIPEYLDIVITKQNRKPVIDSIQAIPATGPYLTYASFTVNDSTGGNNNHLADFSEAITLNVGVNNVGVMTAYNVTATISTSDTNIVITDNTFVYDSIPAGSMTIGTDAFAMSVNNLISDQHPVFCDLIFTDGNDTWTGTLTLVLNAPVLAVNDYIVSDPLPGGNNNGILDPGESATLKISTNNTGHASVNNAIAHLIVDPASVPYIIVYNPNIFLGTLPPNTIINAEFNVVTNGIAPVGTLVNVIYSESAGQQNQYTALQPFLIELGQLPQYTMQNGYKNTCAGKFFDTGGEIFNYGNNENLTMTFYPGTMGASVKAEFTMFSVEPSSNCNYDQLKIYNGANVLMPLIGTYCDTVSPGTIMASNPDGALTFRFHSDYSDNYPGWIAIMSCFGGPLTLMANAFPAQVCEGSSSRLSVIPTGGSGNYTFQWNPSTYLDDPTSQFPLCTPEANITYTVTVNDGTTTLTSGPVEVTLLPVPEPAVIELNGNELVSSVADGNQWYLNGLMIPGANQQTYTPEYSGSYYVTITDQVTGCSSVPSNSIYYTITGIGITDVSNPVTVYPNPFTDRINISCFLPEPSYIRITLTDAFGRNIEVLEDISVTHSGTHTLTAAPGHIDPGIYYCRVQTAGYTVVKKVIFTR
jgi:hypothetical protein